MTILFCFVFGLIFLTLPFWPSILEVMRPSDSQALKITNHILRDPRSSPEFLFWHFAHVLGADSIEALETLGRVDTGTLLNESILAIPGGLVSTIPKTVGRVLASSSIELSPKTVYLSKIASLRSISTGTGNAINEIHAKEKLVIRADTKVMWWASAAEIVLQNHLDLPGKIQATQSITIEGGIQFHHLEAPVIATQIGSTDAPKIREDDFVALPLVPSRHAYKEHCEIKAGDTVEGDLIVKGNLILHENAKILGSVKCHKKVILKEGSRITGNLVSLGPIECEGNNWIGGSILGQKIISFKNSVHVGSENQRVTVSANEIQIDGAFRAHGTLRAWTRGIVSGQ
jgi:cytoskeletal protein CcmA (bactofilin family)